MEKKKNSGNPSEAKTTNYQVSEEMELMKFLILKLTNKSRDNIKSLLKHKQIKIDGKTTSQFNELLKPGQAVEVRWDRVPEERKLSGIRIIFEDKHIIVVDKEAGMLSIATDSEKKDTAYNILSDHVKSQHHENKIFIVHRLDRDTSGLMMFAKSEKIQALLQEDWHTTINERSYVAVVDGEVEKPEGVITSYLRESKAMIVYSSQNPKDGQKAVTHYQTIKKNKLYTLLKVSLETGRKNQIRVHMQDLGHSIVGDKKYGSKINPIGRLGLHAWILSFTHPVTKEEMRFESQIPFKFSKLF